METSAINSHTEDDTLPPRPLETKKSIIILLSVFLCSLLAMIYVYMSFPELNESEKKYIKIPWDIEDAKLLAKVLDQYKDMYYFEVMFGIVITYIFLQTFAIPGSLFLSILLGFLFKFPIALCLICFCSSFGASLCYLLSSIVGRPLILHYCSTKTQTLTKYVNKHRDSLFNLMLFLRITPLLPNWFINLSAPIVGVPLYPFALGTFLGVAPPSVLAIQAGKTLQTMSTASGAFSWTNAAVLTASAAVAIVPVFFKNKVKNKLE